MPNIITRYLALEILKSCAATVLILYLLFMSNALGRVLSDIADGDIPKQALGPVLLSQSVNIFSLLLPIGVFLGIVFAFGRLYKDHEMVVMSASGMGYRQYYRSVLLVIVPVFLFSVYISVWLNAQVQRSANNSVYQGKNTHEFADIRPGQFNRSKNGEHVFFMKSMSADRLELIDIIISQTNRDLMILETAQKGRHKTDEVTGNLFLVVGPGQRAEGQAGKKEYRIIDFEKHGMLVEKKKNSQRKALQQRQKSPEDLRRSKQLKDKVELHWRIAIPVVLLVLALLALPLSYIAPRQGRYGKIGYALLAYIVYFSLMAFTKAQLEAGAFPLVINFWWIHLTFLALTLGLLLRRNRSSINSIRLAFR